MKLIDAERNWEETASDNTGYKLEYNDGIFALYDPQGAILCEFDPDLPTAYDIYKVVEKLEEIRDTHESNIGVYCATDRAIEIVKQGGVADDVCEWKFEETTGITWHCNNECTTYNPSYVKNLKIILDDFECKCPYCGKKIKVVE